MKISALEVNALPPGSTVRHYTVADCLGFDHQGCLYRADCSDDDSSVMLYEYLPQGLVVRHGSGIQAPPGKVDAWKRALATYTTRLRAAGLVGHPALPTLDDIWHEGGTVYAVGPWRAGRSFGGDMSARANALDARVLTHWARALGDALAALHHHELVHGNLSPNLIRVLDGGELLLPLIGSALFTDDTPAWMAPEQHPLNPKSTPIGPWTDVYQLSAVLHQAMTGQAPPSVMRRWEGAPLERLAATVGQYPEGLITATRKGLSMHVAARPQNLEAWLQEAGFPDRREKPRYEAADDPGRPAAGAFQRSAPAPLSDAAEPRPMGSDGRTWAESAAASTKASDRSSDAASTPSANAEMPKQADQPVNTGHQPLSESVQARLEQLDQRRQADKTPTWVWFAAAVAMVALLGIVLLS